MGFACEMLDAPAALVLRRMIFGGGSATKLTPVVLLPLSYLT